MTAGSISIIEMLKNNWQGNTAPISVVALYGEVASQFNRSVIDTSVQLRATMLND